jgi:hypothetical protein
LGFGVWELLRHSGLVRDSDFVIRVSFIFTFFLTLALACASPDQGRIDKGQDDKTLDLNLGLGLRFAGLVA